MQHQMNLKMKDAEPWKGVCCSSCWNARYERCTCRCGGAHHGEGNPNSELNGAVDKRTRLENREQVKADVERLVNKVKDLEYYGLITPDVCPTCSGHLGPIQHHDHSGGWSVVGFEKLQWLFRNCQKCKYDWAIWKLGVPR